MLTVKYQQVILYSVLENMRTELANTYKMQYSK